MFANPEETMSPPTFAEPMSAPARSRASSSGVLICQVHYLEWTRAGRLRGASFHGLLTAP
jgi:hypothetical protein